MQNIKKLVRIVAEKTTYGAVGKSILPMIHDVEVPDEVKAWVDTKKKRHDK